MTDTLRIALAQLNPTVGDVAGNAELVRQARRRAAEDKADLVMVSELFLAGYPPEDLVLKPAFQLACRETAEALAAETADGGPAVLLGTPWLEEGKLYNAVCLLEGGKVAAVRFKADLPNYSVFDEKRVFSPGGNQGPIAFRDVRLGLPICEDFWTPCVAECLAEAGSDILLVPNGSPYEYDKQHVRYALVSDRVRETGRPSVYLNQVGGQDELVFDGASFVTNSDATTAVQMPAFVESQVTTVWRRVGNNGWRCDPGLHATVPEQLESIYQAMMLGLKDYVGKNRFPGILLGLSGGIDSALSLAVAVDALGPDKVRAFMLPSPYTSDDSIEDAAKCAELCGVIHDTVPIEPAMFAFEEMTRDVFAGRGRDVTEENIQSRIRGVTLMAISNKLGHMLLTTGNKSEMSVGYATLYGDMCGGFSVLKDIYKVMVFRLAWWRNANKPERALGPEGMVMPERVLTKAPTAELKPNQTDQDTLPPYEILDGILECLIEQEMTVDEIVAKGFARETVLKVWRMVDIAEYKRRQAPPGVKITRRAFGRDRRYPITNGFRASITPGGAPAAKAGH
ncbi:MAG TPA: NAD+ synthase [Candidatus Cybelea sp.]|nr:NAD+ synthase [Candidatus Cybelea sp.]